MKISFHSLRAIIICLLTAAIMQGCKENTILSSKVSPSGNQVSVLSVSLPCITHTYYDDSAITSSNFGGVPIYQGVGTFTDPFFGSMVGSTYFQIIPSDFGPAVLAAADSNYIDSAVLVLPYSGFTYGNDTGVTQTYQVFYMLDTLGLTTNYYDYSTKPIDINHPLSDPTTVDLLHIGDSMATGLTPYLVPANYPGLRIKLKLPVITKLLLNAQAQTTSSNPAQDFLNNFNGICVRASDSRQLHTAIPYFELDGANTYQQAGIIVYYHNTVSLDTTIESYYFNTGFCGHFNNIVKSFDHAPVNALLHSAAKNDSIIALQNQPGASFDIIVPGIKSIPKGIINKAELRFSILSNDNPNSASLPEKLYPLGIANGTYPIGYYSGTPYEVADRYPLTSVSPLLVLDGYKHPITYPVGPANNPTSVTIQTFTIDLPREVITSIAAGNDTLHFHINGTEDYYGAFHLVAAGGSYGNSNTNDTLYRPKLFVVYSKL